MADESTARAPAPLILFQRILPHIKDAVQPFIGCDTWRHASQAVFSEGNCMMEVTLIGGNPGVSRSDFRHSRWREFEGTSDSGSSFADFFIKVVAREM